MSQSNVFQAKTYQAKQMGPHIFETKGPNAPKWYIVDAKDKVVGRLATVIARVITGKHKATYTRHADAGDFVIVINAEKVVFTRNKWADKKYYSHSGYVSGLKTKSAEEMRDTHPERILKRAVWGMTNKSTLARRQLAKMKIYAGEEHPHSAQCPKPLAEQPAARKSVLKSTKKK